MANFSNLTEPGSMEDEMPLDIIIIGTFSYCLIFIIGFIGNLLVISVLLIEKDLRTFTNYLLANLSIADLMVLMTCVPIGCYELFAKERWHLGKELCYLIGFFENAMSIASILTIFFITLERYWAICRPLSVKSLMTQSRTCKLIIFILAVSIFINIPLIFFSEHKLGRFNNNEIDYMCYINMETEYGEWRRVYSIFVTFIIYVIIGIFLVVMYAKISRHLEQSNRMLTASTHHRIETIDNAFKLRDSKKPKKKRQISELDTDVNNPLTSDSHMNMSGSSNMLSKANDLDAKYIKPRKQLIRMLKGVIIVFYVCLFPLKTWNMFYMFFGHLQWFQEIITLRRYFYINITTRILFYGNSMMNPILYNCLSTKFRKGFRKLAVIRCCKIRKQFMNQPEVTVK